jgi:uncharacterized protein YmfQ (DUF2313 family)
MADEHVRRTGDDYADALTALLPLGQAWPRAYDSALMKTVRGLAGVWGYVDQRAADLLEIESDPRATTEMILDWERNWGLPDPCLSHPPTDLNARRAALVAKMTMLGAQSREFFVGVGKLLGYEIVITEYSPYMTGVSRVGDTRATDPEDVEHYRWQLGPPEMRYYWSIHVNALKLVYFHVNSSQTGIDRLLAIDVAADLNCIFDRWKPAHTDIVYDFSPMEALNFTQSFNSQYLAMGIM